MNLAVAGWIADLTLDPETVATYKNYAKSLFIPYFRTLDGITRGSVAAYTIARMRRVLRSTVKKERSALRKFCEWCAEEPRSLGTAPEFPPMPHGTGVRSGKQRSAPVACTPEQVAAFLLALPERSRRGLAVRARYVVMYETSLRPETLDVIAVPADYRKGASDLRIDGEDDKARYARMLPLSELAGAALDSVCPERGRIFGRHDFRAYVKAAAKAVGLPPEFSDYDLRHARAQHLVDAGVPLTAVQFLLGHVQLSTTNRYVRADRKGAERAVGYRGPSGARAVRGRGLEPLRVISSLEPERNGEGLASEITRGIADDAERIRALEGAGEGVSGSGPQRWRHQFDALLAVGDELDRGLAMLLAEENAS
jgi:integrase